MWPLTLAGILAHCVSRSTARLVVSEHIALSNQYGGKGRAHAAILHRSLAFFYFRADAQIVVSRSAADDLARLGGLPRASMPEPTGGTS